MRKIASFCDEVVALVRSGHQAISVQTVEEKRFLDDLNAITPRLSGGPPWRVITWDWINGYSDGSDDGTKMAGNLTEAFLAIPTDRFNVPDGMSDVIASKPGVVTGIHVINAVNTAIVLNNDEKHPILLSGYVGPVVKVGDSVTPGQVVGKVHSNHVLFVFKDVNLVLNENGAGMAERRAFRNLVETTALSNSEAMRPVIFLGTSPINHADLAASITVVKYSLPTVEDLGKTVDYIASAVEGGGEIRPDFKRKIVDAMRGFSLVEAENTLALIGYASEGFHYGEKQEEEEETLVSAIYKRKRDRWSNEAGIELMDSAKLGNFNEIGGYDLFKTWIRKRKYCLTDAAKSLGVPEMKGTILGGLPGTGKSVIATIVAKELGLPLVELKFSAMFGSLLGESEARMRDALAKITALGPCVVRVDEADKAMTGIKGSADNDGGVSKRLLGEFLSWQANTNKDAFVVMTLNDLKSLSPEQVRTGRFDRVWFVDLPSDEEREEIFRIHLRKRGYDPEVVLSKSEYVSLAGTTRGASGSDIEAIVKEAMLDALAESEGKAMHITYDHLIGIARGHKNSAKVAGESLDNIRDMFEGRAYPVSSYTGGGTTEKPRAKSTRAVSIKN